MRPARGERGGPGRLPAGGVPAEGAGRGAAQAPIPAPIPAPVRPRGRGRSSGEPPCARWRREVGARRGGLFSSCLRVLAAVLVVRLDGADAADCGPGEYPIGAECCPMCAAGLRVFKHCTANSSTTCIPCVQDTYTDHPNGLERCKTCKLCDRGANLVPEVPCTYTKNTVCGCLPGYFCSYFGTEDCELCQRYTICFPGSMVKERGTKTTDNVCEACPPGTSSTANMSYSCTPWSKLREDGLVEGEDRNPSSDSSVTVIVASVIGVVLVVAPGLIYIWQRRKRKIYVPPVQESGGGQQDQALISAMKNGDQTTVPVQETGASPEPRPE